MELGKGRRELRRKRIQKKKGGGGGERRINKEEKEEEKKESGVGEGIRIKEEKTTIGEEKKR